jgi:hypothetical protein
MNPFNVNSEPRNCSNLLTTPRYAPTINCHLLLNQKKSARKIDIFSSLLVRLPAGCLHHGGNGRALFAAKHRKHLSLL